MLKGQELLHYPQHAPLRRKRLARGAEAVGRKFRLKFRLVRSIITFLSRRLSLPRIVITQTMSDNQQIVTAKLNVLYTGN